MDRAELTRFSRADFARRDLERVRLHASRLVHPLRCRHVGLSEIEVGSAKIN